MKDEVSLHLLRWQIQPVGTNAWPSTTLEPFGSVATLNALQRPQSASGLPTIPLSKGSGPYSSRDLRVPHLEEDCPYLANLSGHTLEEILETLARYTQSTSTTLALGWTDRYDAIWFDQEHEKNHRFEESVYNSGASVEYTPAGNTNNFQISYWDMGRPSPSSNLPSSLAD